jgi:uncharacterized protein YcbX
MLTVSRIYVYPVKSLDACAVPEALVSSGGGLATDREFAFFTEAGRTVNAKKFPDIQKIRAKYELSTREVQLSAEGQSVTFHLDKEQALFTHWMSEYLGQPVQLRQHAQGGFPDDTDRSGPTIISEETIAQVQLWFPSLTPDNIRRRFRANIEISGGRAFEEERLFGTNEDAPVLFQIGQVKVLGVKPCARCPVPARNPDTGEADTGFQLAFTQHREAAFPEGVAHTQFPHYYYLSINTQIPATEAGKKINLTDKLLLL